MFEASLADFSVMKHLTLTLLTQVVIPFLTLYSIQ